MKSTSDQFASTLPLLALAVDKNGEELSLAAPSRGEGVNVISPNDYESLSWKCLGAGLIGNVLEWYDFGLYGFLAPLIAANFFPSANPIASLLGAYGVFAIGFAMRPVGAAIFGHIGDRIGRRAVLLSSILLMGFATTVIGVLPTYGEAGIWAPVLLVGIRLFQGLSVGGQYTGSASYLVETAPSRRRGFAGSFVNIGSAGGYILSAALAAVTLLEVHHHSVLPWIWRLPFLTGGVIASLAFLLRRYLTRTGYQPEDNPRIHRELPLKQAFRESPRNMTIAMVFSWGYGVLSYLTLVFLPVFAGRFGNVNIGKALAINASLQLLAVAFIPFAGWLTDRFIRRRTLMLLVFAVVSLSAIEFFNLAAGGGLWEFWVAQGSLIVLVFLVEGTEPAMMTELFPSRYRMSGYSVALNFGLGIGGGTAPLIATALMGPLGRLAGAAYLSACAVITLGALWLMMDWSREPLR